MLEQGEYPFYCVFLNINPKEVDVNVHPSKLEVKFSNERNIYTVINAVVRKSMFRSDLAPSAGFRDITRGDDFTSGIRLESPETRGEFPQPRYDSFSSLQRGMGAESAGSTRMNPREVDDLFRSIGIGPGEGQPPSRTEGDRTILLPSEKPISDTQFVWQLHNKYIFTPIKSGLMIIDQHVAHERVLYEKALQALDHAAPFSQQLLFPHTFRVSPSDYSLLQELQADLEHLGFVIDISPPNDVTVNAVPQDVRFGMEEVILQEILEQYKEYMLTGTTDVRHNMAASFGCKAAIKAGDKLSPPEMQILIDKLFATSNPYVCPHGRPIVIKLSLDDLDLRFGRT
jgi:DNA mismatch repair protein MutL